MATVAPAQNVRIQLKQEAKKINNLMKVKKMTITKNVNKWLTLLNQFKQEQNYGNSPLVEQAAREVETLYRKLKAQLQIYINLCVQTTETSEGVLEQKILEQSAQMDKYSKAVDDIKRNNREAFKEIYLIIDSHKIQRPIGQLPAQISAMFKPALDLRPAPLVYNCTLIEMHQFNEQFVKYINSSIEQAPPEGVIFGQACVNID